ASACLLGACVGGGRAPVRVPVRVVAPIPIRTTVEVRVEAWTRLSTATAGTTVESQAPEDIPVLIRGIFDDGLPSGPVDVVFVVDTTGSMGDDIDAVRRDMREILDHLRRHNPDYRVGVVAYRDVDDDYLTRTFLALTRDDARIQQAITALTVGGGDDWREHVYAGINTALGQPWRPEASQHIILMGDAPPHDDYTNDPRTLDSVTARAQRAPLRVHIHTIGIKCDATCEQVMIEEDAARAAQSRVLP
ncbi:MAG: VWA domain-containing protein, partial [Myxococcales bacterium]|nr:VWA domain-containing protein [Myxococcales bacterium]